jgi:hypothetical protein
MTDYISNIRDTCKHALYLVRDFIGFTIEYINETTFLFPLDIEDDEYLNE